jgi:hypothetical protein
VEVPHPDLSRDPRERLATVEAEVRTTPEVAGYQSYESLVNNNGALKAEFIAASAGNLNLAYKRFKGVELEELVDLAHQSEATLVTLIGSERDDKVEALFDALEYRESEMFMVWLATKMNDESLPPAERAEAANWFKEANEALYGVPENGTFSAIARTRLQPYMQADYTHDPEARQLQEELRERVGYIEDEGKQLAETSPEGRERFAALIHEKFDSILEHIQPRYEPGPNGELVEKLFTPEEMAEAIRVALDKIGATELGWRCEIIPEKELMAVSAHQKLVEVGENREPAGAAELRAKVAHEVGVHAWRSANAEKAGWVSAAYGQQKYLDFEESFANAVGEVYWGAESAAAPQYRYLAFGLAYGLDGHEPRDMRDTYEVMWRTIALDSRKGGALDVAKAKNTAFIQTLRLFRGTPTDVPGLTYNKDLAYVVGDEKVRPVIDLIETPEDLELFFAGKLDPTLPDHLPIAEDIVPNTRVAGRIREKYGLAA